MQRNAEMFKISNDFVCEHFLHDDSSPAT